jgi:hypothetical protein
MSGDHAKKEMETGDKPTTSHGKASSEESRKKGKGKEKKSSSHKSHRSGDKKKKMRKVVGVSRPGGSLGRRVNVAACPSPDGSSARASAKGGERGGRRPV